MRITARPRLQTELAAIPSVLAGEAISNSHCASVVHSKNQKRLSKRTLVIRWIHPPLLFWAINSNHTVNSNRDSICVFVLFLVQYFIDITVSSLKILFNTYEILFDCE